MSTLTETTASDSVHPWSGRSSAVADPDYDMFYVEREGFG